MKPLALCVQMEKERLLRLSFLAMGLGVRVKSVDGAKLGQTLGALCGLDEEKPSPAPAQGVGEMLVLAFFEDAQLDRFLAALRQNDLIVPLKAVLTPNNRHWNCAQLYQELKSEAAAFAAQRGKQG
ncbi:MAG: DUF3783 domain-containing protein [Clostridia bacterium]|nr:DUF3783 domain-containing protein [Clostridia bacterium]